MLIDLHSSSHVFKKRLGMEEETDSEEDAEEDETNTEVDVTISDSEEGWAIFL